MPPSQACFSQVTAVPSMSLLCVPRLGVGWRNTRPSGWELNVRPPGLFLTLLLVILSGTPVRWLHISFSGGFLRNMSSLMNGLGQGFFSVETTLRLRFLTDVFHSFCLGLVNF